MAKHESASCKTSSGLTCRVYASLNPTVDAAAIFVHGFRGDQERTWRHFQTMIDEHQEFDSFDAYFVGYSSTDEQIGSSAYKLTALISELVPQPPAEMFVKRARFSNRQVSIRDSTPRYRRLTLVGHSQGGAVIRKAVLEAAKEAVRSGTAADDLLCGADIALFAPALFGMFLSGWKGFAASTSLWKLVGPILSGSPSFKELQPGSQFLSRLESETSQLAADNPSKVAALSARIVWASGDKIVQGFQRYSCDPPYKRLDGDHTSICKPRPGGHKPLFFVLGKELS